MTKMNMYLDLNLATFQYIDEFSCYHIYLNRFGLELMIFFWTSSQLRFSFGNAAYCNFRFSFRTPGYCRTAG